MMKILRRTMELKSFKVKELLMKIIRIRPTTVTKTPTITLIEEE